MYELVKAAENTYYIENPAKVGIYILPDQSAYIVDSGNDKDAGRKIEKIIKENSWNLKAIINTHSNADHIGGNRVLEERTGCAIYSKDIEACFTRNPILEPSFLYGGFPYKGLCNKFLVARSSNCSDIKDLELPEGFELIDLPGHYFHQIGLKTPDNVWFLADSLFGTDIISKYHYSFIYDVGAQFETLEKIEKLQGVLFVPAHAAACTDIANLVDANRRALMENLEEIEGICTTPGTFEDIMKEIFDRHGLIMDNNQYVLMGSTIKSYLSYLSDQGRIQYEFRENKMYWALR